ncbi:hypothetical protein BJV78DRAFT_1135723, partial [Lactifluus subvellereus]
DDKAREVVETFYVTDHVDKWSTPWLVIHSSKDFRLPQTDWIGVFCAPKQCAHLPTPWFDQIVLVLMMIGEA